MAGGSEGGFAFPREARGKGQPGMTLRDYSAGRSAYQMADAMLAERGRG